MPFKYKAVQRNSQPGKKGGTLKWYASAAEREEINIDELARQIAQRSTLSVADSRAAVIAITELIPDYLSQGTIVRLGELGDLRVALSSDGVANQDEVSPNVIREAHINFRPGATLQAMLKNMEYRKD